MMSSTGLPGVSQKSWSCPDGLVAPAQHALSLIQPSLIQLGMQRHHSTLSPKPITQPVRPGPHLSISCPSTTLSELSWPSGVRSNKPGAQSARSSKDGSWACMPAANEATVSSVLPWLELPPLTRGCAVPQ
eukprot:1146728-Pelagomonas_calceolata.AAC.2